MDIVKILKKEANLDYKVFQEKICHTNYYILGVKVPTLRKIAKKLLKENNYLDLLKMLDDDYYESVMLQALIIGNVKISINDKINLINNFLPKIDCWAICDIFVSELKIFKNNQQEMLIYLKTLLKSNQEYYLRFAIVSLLTYYINDTYYEEVLNLLININSDYYYVKMAIAWAYSILLTKYFKKTTNFLITNQNNIDKWTYNKALQKGRESFKLSKDEKERLKKLKIT